MHSLVWSTLAIPKSCHIMLCLAWTVGSSAVWDQLVFMFLNIYSTSSGGMVVIPVYLGLESLSTWELGDTFGN